MIRPGPTTPPAPTNASHDTPPQSLHAVAAGDPARMTAVLRKMAKAEGAGIQDEDGIERALAARRSTAFPATEHFLVAARAARLDKDGPSFETAWQAADPRATSGPRIRPEYGIGADPGFQPSVRAFPWLRSLRLQGVRLGS